MEINGTKNDNNKQMNATYTNISKSLCKIETGSKNLLDTGFLLKFYIEQECFYCLISNEHVINQDIINNNNIIHIYYDNENKVTNLKIRFKKKIY